MNFKKLLLAISVVVSALMPIHANAADMEVIAEQNGFAQIFIKGPIEQGDSSKFYKLAERYERASIILQSPGGSVMEALSIGAEIAIRGFTTFAIPGDGCYSACALIWVSGIRRHMTEDAVIGVHAAYRTFNSGDGSSEARESGAGNAQIGAFLNELGLSADAIFFFTQRGPSEFNYLSPVLAQRLDIDVYVQRGTTTQTPEDRPTPRRIADNTSRLLMVSARCSELLDLNAQQIQNQGSDILRSGHSIFGGEVFAELIVEYSDIRKAEIDKMGVPAWCLATEDKLRRSGNPLVGLDGPSYNCARAGTTSERTLCDSSDLWAEDRAMAWAYRYLKQNVTESQFAGLRTDQRQWIARREDCGRNIACKQRLYDARLTELGVY